MRIVLKQICDLKQCTGCMVCYDSCPRKAIEQQEREGFFYPVINEQICIGCGLCADVCPTYHAVSEKRPLADTAYAVFHKDKQVRDNSSSGGVFYSLAKSILAEGGVVYGAAWTKEVAVKHIRIDSAEDISLLQGSKYVQSDMRDMYNTVRADLQTGKKVLFSGVPCQIAGLQSYLQIKYDNLYTCEVLCHGNGSPVIFEEHRKYISRTCGSEVVKVDFRHKTEKRCQNLAIGFQNGTSVLINNPMEDWYYYGFLTGIVLRPSCYQCQYVGTERMADITLADFWGLKEGSMKFPDHITYPSLVFVNSRKGQTLFQKNIENWEIVRRSVEEAVWGNLSLRRALPEHKWRKKFFKEYHEYGYERAGEKCLIPHFDWKDRIKKMIGKKATAFLVKVLKR